MSSLNKDTVEVLVCLARIASGIGFVIEDGRLSLGDIGHFARAASSAIPALDGISNVRANDLKDPEARAEAIEIFSVEFDIPQEKAEVFIEEGVDLGVKLFDYGVRLVNEIRQEEKKES